MVKAHQMLLRFEQMHAEKRQVKAMTMPERSQYKGSGFCSCSHAISHTQEPYQRVIPKRLPNVQEPYPGAIPKSYMQEPYLRAYPNPFPTAIPKSHTQVPSPKANKAVLVFQEGFSDQLRLLCVMCLLDTTDGTAGAVGFAHCQQHNINRTSQPGTRLAGHTKKIGIEMIPGGMHQDIDPIDNISQNGQPWHT